MRSDRFATSGSSQLFALAHVAGEGQGRGPVFLLRRRSPHPPAQRPSASPAGRGADLIIGSLFSPCARLVRPPLDVQDARPCSRSASRHRKEARRAPVPRLLPAARRAFFLGALLPDLIDKPLFYIPFWLTGRRGELLSGTHLFAHTGLFLLALIVAAWLTRSAPARAVAIGVATHFVLDCVGLSMGLETLLWPLFGWRFPAYPFSNVGQHLATVLNPVTLSARWRAARSSCGTTGRPGATRRQTDEG